MKSTVVVTRNRSSADELEVPSHHPTSTSNPAVNPIPIQQSSAADEHSPITSSSHSGRVKQDKSRATPEKTFPEWPLDASQLDYKEELTLEMKRQQLKRELELEMQKEEKAEKQRSRDPAKRAGSSSSSSRSTSSSNSSGSGTASSSSDSSSSSSSDDSDDSSSSSSSSSSSISSRGKHAKRVTGSSQKPLNKSSKHGKESGRAKESLDSHRERPKSRSGCISKVNKHRSQSKDKNSLIRTSRKHSNSPPNDSYSYTKRQGKDKTFPGQGRSVKSENQSGNQGTRRESRGRGSNKTKGKSMSTTGSSSTTKRGKEWPSNMTNKERDESSNSRRHKKKKNQGSKDKGPRGRRSPVKAPAEMSPTSRLWASRHKRQAQLEDRSVPPRAESRDLSNKENNSKQQESGKDHRKASEQSPPGRKRYRSNSPSSLLHHSTSQISKADAKATDMHYRNTDNRKSGLSVDSQMSQNRHNDDNRSTKKDPKHSLSPALVSSIHGRSPKDDPSRSRPSYQPPGSKDNIRIYPPSQEKRDTNYPPPPPPAATSSIYKWVRNRTQLSPPRDRTTFASATVTNSSNRHDPSPDQRKRVSEPDKGGRRGYEKPREDPDRRRDPRKGKEDSGKKKDRSSSWDREKKHGETSTDLVPELDSSSRIHPHDDHRKVDALRRPRDGDLAPYSMGTIPLRPGELDKERDIERRRRAQPLEDPKHYRRAEPEKSIPYPKGGHKGVERPNDREDLPPVLPPSLPLRREHRYPDVPPHMRDPRDPDYMPMDHLPPHHPLVRDGRDPRDPRGDPRVMDPRDIDPRDHPPLPRPLPPEFSPDRYPDYRYGERDLDRYGRRIKDYELPPLHRDDHLAVDPRDHYPGYRRDDYYGDLLPHEHWDGHYGRGYPPPSHHDMLPPMHHSPPPPMYRNRGEPPDRPLDRYRDHMGDMRPEGRTREEDARLLDRRPPRHRSPEWANRRDDRWSASSGAPPASSPAIPPIAASTASPTPSSETPAKGAFPPALATEPHRKPSPAKRERGREQSPGSHGSWEHNSRHGSQSSEGHRSSSSSSQKKDESKSQPPPSSTYITSRLNRHDRSNQKTSSSSKSKKRSRSKTPTLPPPPPTPLPEAEVKKTRPNSAQPCLASPLRTQEVLEKPIKELLPENNSEKNSEIKEHIISILTDDDVAVTSVSTVSLTVVETSGGADAIIIAQPSEKPLKDLPSKKESNKVASDQETLSMEAQGNVTKQEMAEFDKDEKEAGLSDWSDDDDDELLIRDDVTEIDDLKASSDDDKESDLLKAKSDTQSDTFSIKSTEDKEHRRSQSLERPLKETGKKQGRREARIRDESRVSDSKLQNSEKDNEKSEFNSAEEESVDYEPISDDELDALMEESEAEAKAAPEENALNVDWSSLQQVKSEKSEAGSARKRFGPVQILHRIGLSQAWAGPAITKKLIELSQEEEQEPIKLEHPIAIFHLATVRARQKRGSVLQQMGPFRQALCARQDLWIRRQLCKGYAIPKVHISNKTIESFGFTSSNVDKDLYKLSLELLRKPKEKPARPTVCVQ